MQQIDRSASDERDYVAPTIEDLGSVEELTGAGNNPDLNEAPFT